MTQIKVLIVLLVLAQVVKAQEITRKHLDALRIENPLTIDGMLNEPSYSKAQPATDFVQLVPNNGQAANQETEVYIFYDDNAIYLGAMLYDNPDSIRSFITTRDVIGVSDYFGVMFDTNAEGLLSFEFFVTPANSQIDLKGIKSGGRDHEDSSWDAVWQSATKILDNGWCVEFRIPYSALRFPAEEEPIWRINFFRRIRRYNSNTSWNLINNKISGFIQQAGELHGLKNIKPPLRLSISPYLAQYVENKPGSEKSDYIFKGGLDLKVGLSQSHTLDMMLIPDFGQIQSDDEELNLSPYELYYDEKRQFFNEGLELFGRADIFYSRRIGTEPIFSSDAHNNLDENEKVSFNPSSTQMINATKVTGRDKNGWGVGVLNAVTLPAKAEIENTLTGETRQIITQPFTNYNVSLIEKALKNNSFVSVINTNMSMLDNPYSANVTATEFQLKNNTETFQLSGSGCYSYRNSANEKWGHGYDLEIAKVKGKFNFHVEQEVMSDKLNFNDLGYMEKNNFIENNIEISYNVPDPFGIFKSWGAEIIFENQRRFNPRVHVSNSADFNTSAIFKNNWWAGYYLGYIFDYNDYDETRTLDRFFIGPPHYSTEISFQTNVNKPVSLSCNLGMYDTGESKRWGNWLSGTIWWKAGRKINLVYAASAQNIHGSRGYVGQFNSDSVFFGIFERQTLSNRIQMSYTPNTKTYFEFRVRHYWSQADYDPQIYFLKTNGTLSPTSAYLKNPDVNYNAFNIDMYFAWDFAPGSVLSIAWKREIYNSDDQMGLGYFSNLENTCNADRTNSISIKLLYYIDYASFRK